MFSCFVSDDRVPEKQIHHTKHLGRMSREIQPMEGHTSSDKYV